MRHGPVDMLRVREAGSGDGPPPVKECPNCHALILDGYARRPHCGYEFPDRGGHAIEPWAKAYLKNFAGPLPTDVRIVAQLARDAARPQPSSLQNARCEVPAAGHN
jgi:hypothetical protein